MLTWTDNNKLLLNLHVLHHNLWQNQSKMELFPAPPFFPYVTNLTLTSAPRLHWIQSYQIFILFYQKKHPNFQIFRGLEKPCYVLRRWLTNERPTCWFLYSSEKSIAILVLSTLAYSTIQYALVKLFMCKSSWLACN